MRSATAILIVLIAQATTLGLFMRYASRSTDVIAELEDQVNLQTLQLIRQAARKPVCDPDLGEIITDARCRRMLTDKDNELRLAREYMSDHCLCGPDLEQCND